MNEIAHVPMSDDPIILRGLLHPALLESFVSLVRESYAQLDQQTSNGGVIADDELRSSYVWGAITVPRLKSHFAGSSILKQVHAAIQRVVPQAKFHDEFGTIRRFLRPTEHLAWHIDADAVGTVRIDPCFNAWFPLSPVGLTAPSLEIIPNSDERMREFPLLSPEAGERDDAWRRTHFPGAVFCPTLVPGDVVIFSHYTLHRTQPMENHSGRMSAELRFTMDSAVPIWSRIFKMIKPNLP